MLAGQFWRLKSTHFRAAERRGVKTSDAAERRPEVGVAHLAGRIAPSSAPILARGTWPIGVGIGHTIFVWTQPPLGMMGPGTQGSWKADRAAGRGGAAGGRGAGRPSLTSPGDAAAEAGRRMREAAAAARLQVGGGQAGGAAERRRAGPGSVGRSPGRAPQPQRGRLKRREGGTRAGKEPRGCPCSSPPRVALEREIWGGEESQAVLDLITARLVTEGATPRKKSLMTVFHRLRHSHSHVTKIQSLGN